MLECIYYLNRGKMNNREIKEYYDKHYCEVSDNTEGLFNNITTEFEELIKNKKKSKNKLALDLGYGYGNYSIYMAERGYKVDAIDVVEANWFKTRLEEKRQIIKNIRIISQDIVQFRFKKKYNIIVSKDVLHYLNREKLQCVLSKIAKSTDADASVYIVMFTDIIRRNQSGTLQKKVDEADLSYDEWVKLLYFYFNDWEISINKEEYKEREKYNINFEYYFEANKVSCILTKR